MGMNRRGTGDRGQRMDTERGSAKSQAQGDPMKQQHGHGATNKATSPREKTTSRVVGGGEVGGEFKGPLSLDDLKALIKGATSSSGTGGGFSSPGVRLSYRSSKSQASSQRSGSGVWGIARACVGVETWLKQNSDDHRAFFDSVFRLLLQDVFGLGKPKDKSWLYLASKTSSSSTSSSRSSGGANDNAKYLKRLLHPHGVLMSAILEADERDLYPHGFTFPIESLPAVAGIARTQSLLRQGQAKLMAELPHYFGRLVSSSSSSSSNTKSLRSPNSRSSGGATKARGGHLAGGSAGGGGNIEVRLSLWEYFISWLVFYAIQEPMVAGSSSSRSSSSSSSLSSSFNDLSNLSWNTGLSAARELLMTGGMVGSYGLSSRLGTSSKSSTPVYKDLLDLYIKTFIHFGPIGIPGGVGATKGMSMSPRGGFQASPLVSPSTHSHSHSHASSSSSSSLATKRQFMLDVMFEFWLADVNQVEGHSSMRTASFVCPSSDLIASIKQLVNHLMHTAGGGIGGGGESSMMMGMRTPGGANSTGKHGDNKAGKHDAYVTMWNTKRALYRFLLRCFALWPAERSVSLKPVIDLWVTYIAPWEGQNYKSSSRNRQQQMAKGRGTTSGQESMSTSHNVSSMIRRTVSGTKSSPISMSTSSAEKKAKAAASGGGSEWSEWKDHILSNMPFYTILLQYFINIEYARATARPESAISDLIVLVDSALSCSGGGRSNSHSLVSFLRETEQDLHMHSLGSLTGSKYFERFSLIRHDYHELHKYSLQGLPSNYILNGGETVFNILHSKGQQDSAMLIQLQQTMDVLSISRKLSSHKLRELASLCGRVFDYEFKLPTKSGRHASQSGQDRSNKKSTMYRSFTWHDVVAFQKRYRGDWMKRPVASYEIPLLVSFWIELSERANKVLGLDEYEGAAWLHQHSNDSHEDRDENNTEGTPTGGNGNSNISMNHHNAVLGVLSSVLVWLKHKKVRVNLRFLAGWWPSLVLLSYLLSLFWLSRKTLLWPWTPLVAVMLSLTGANEAVSARRKNE
jgi:hypothetical protein